MTRPPQQRHAPGDATTVPLLVVYSRKECHLCDVAKADIEALGEYVRFDVEVHDVDTDTGWAEAYGDQVPVGFIGTRKVFKYRVDREALERALLAAT